MATQAKKNNAKVEKEIVKEADVSEVVKVDANDNSQSTQKEIEALESQLKDKDAKIDLLTANMAAIQAQLQLLMQEKVNGSFGKKEEESDVLIGCRGIDGGGFATNDGSMGCTFECDEEKYVDAEDFKVYLKESHRNLRSLFEKDLFYFVNPEDYDRFKIRKKVDLSRDNILRILNLPINNMIDEVNLITHNLNDRVVRHTFQFEIVKILQDPTAPLTTWDYNNRVALENYLGQKFDVLRDNVGALKFAKENKRK